MPTYGFRCPDGHEFDRFYKTMSSAPSETACPECGKVGARQLRAGAGLMFKGSGFYLTDYGKNAHRGEGTKASLDPSSVPPKSETKGDSAPAKTESAAPKSESASAKAESAAPKSETPKSKTESKPAKKPKSE
jgi:putative FmdB family regulatory protein